MMGDDQDRPVHECGELLELCRLNKWAEVKALLLSDRADKLDYGETSGTLGQNALLYVLEEGQLDLLELMLTRGKASPVQLLLKHGASRRTVNRSDPERIPLRFAKDPAVRALLDPALDGKQ
jgi:hypothetical protein